MSKWLVLLKSRVGGIVLNNNSTLVTSQLDDSGMFPEVGRKKTLTMFPYFFLILFLCDNIVDNIYLWSLV